MKIDNCFSDIMCHLVGISHHYKIVFMSSTTVCRAVSRARTWFAAVYRWVILPSGISSDCRCPLDVAGRKLCVKWKMNILVTFCINFATRSASRYSLFQVWNVRKICQQSATVTLGGAGTPRAPPGPSPAAQGGRASVYKPITSLPVSHL